MTITPLKELTYNTTNIPDDNTPIWDIEAGYFKETVRQLDNKLYKNFNTIDPLATYLYNNTDPLNEHYTLRLADSEVMTPTSVPCIKDETVVYVVDNDTYYLYNDADADVDFTTIDMASPSNFDIITGYRHDIYDPRIRSDIWYDMGYTNKYKQLDQSLGSQTIVNGDMEMSFLLSKIDSVSLFNLQADLVEIIVTQIDTDTEIYNQSFDTKSKNSGGTFWGYFFNSFGFITKISADIPINFNLRIDINLRGSETRCGLVGIGKSEFIGATLYGAGIGMIDFSKKDTNDFGETYLVKRAYKSTNSLTLDVDTGRVDSVVNLLNKYRSTPIIFKGADSLTSTYVYGIYNNYDVLVNLPTISKINIDIESLI